MARCYCALAASIWPSSPLSDAQYWTGRVTGYCVAKIPQAAQDAGLRTSSDHENIRSQSARRLGQHVSNRADGDADRSVRTSGALQRLDAAARCFSFRRLRARLQIQFNRQVRPIPDGLAVSVSWSPRAALSIPDNQRRSIPSRLWSSSILRKRPACVGMMMRSNPFVRAPGFLGGGRVSLQRASHSLQDADRRGGH